MRAAERLFFENPALYRAKCFIIETVIWKWILSGVFQLEPRPMPHLDDLFRDKRVLIAACGPGDVSTGPSCETAREVHAFDISPAFVEACRKNRPTWRVFQGDVANIPFPDGFFDVAIIYSSLHHIPLEAEVVLRELARVTKGTIVIVEQLAPERGWLRHALLGWWAITDGGVHYYTRSELEAVMKKLALKVERLTQHGPIEHMMLGLLTR